MAVGSPVEQNWWWRSGLSKGRNTSRLGSLEVIVMTGRSATALVVGAVVLLVGSATACSSGFWDPGGIEFHIVEIGLFTHPQELGAIPFTATGKPVDDGIVCDGGTVTTDRLESIDGDVLTVEESAALMDTAEENEGTVEVYVFQDFECDDGSGTVTMKVHPTFDFSTYEFEGEQDVGTWEIEEGTGSYQDLSGSGDVTVDWDNDHVKYDGDVS
jgi:hypothetical protein